MYYIDDLYKLIIEFKDGRINNIIDYEEDLMGNIYRGRVVKIVKSLEAAFIDIGIGENCFLPLKGAKEKIIEGQSLLVQIKKVPVQTKAPKLTTELSISGRYIIYFINSDIVKFSKKLSKQDVYKLKKMKLENVLFRSEAKYADIKEIMSEYNKLQEIAEKIKSEKDRLPVPKIIYEKNILKNFLMKNIEDEIITNSIKIFKEYKNKLNIKYEDSSIIYKNDILKDYNSLFERKIDLDFGCNIVIDRAESLTAIDINTASFDDETDFEKTALNTNLKAGSEIARQIKLRNIAGIIIIDFINMKDEESREVLLENFKNECIKDNSKVEVFGYTKLGLMEVSRKNNGEELKNRLKGEVK